MNIHRLSKIVDGKVISKNKKDIILKASIHSKELVDGGIFIIVGDVKKYSEEILTKASVIIGEYSLGKKVGFIEVENSIEALKKFAKYNLENSNVEVIGITGSCGKTTLKELSYNILSTKYKVLKNSGNENNIIGVCKTLLRLDDSYDKCILEMGMNHVGEISEISMLTNPKYALITNIGTSHIGNLNNKTGILKAKLEILDGMDNNNLIVNGDDKFLKKLKCFKVGKGYFNDLRLKKIKYNIHKTKFDINAEGVRKHINFKYGGKHYPILIGMAIYLGLIYEINHDDCINGLNNFETIEGRNKIYYLKNNNILIDDSYNASLESFKNVIEFVKKEKKKKLFIVGDVLESGNHSIEIHSQIIKELNKVKNSEIWYMGKNFIKLGTKLKMGLHYEIDEVIKNIKDSNLENVIIVVKASHKFNFNEICEEIKKIY